MKRERIIKRNALLLIALVCLAIPVVGQSGRSWMNGFVFADSDTQGLAGATITLTGDQNNQRLKSVKLTTVADKDGSYSIKDIPYGSYTFRVSSDGYEPYEIKLYIGSDMLTELHVKLSKK